MQASGEPMVIVPLPPSAAKKYIPIKPAPSREGPISICIARKPASPNLDVMGTDNPRLFAVKVFSELHIRTPLQITHLQKLKNE
jgi:hypothetical protein